MPPSFLPFETGFAHLPPMQAPAIAQATFWRDFWNDRMLCGLINHAGFLHEIFLSDTRYFT